VKGKRRRRVQRNKESNKEIEMEHGKECTGIGMNLAGK
jgi:hypothetical protein